MSFIRNQLDSHIILNVERIDFNEKFKNVGNGDTLLFENQLHGIIAEAFEHLKGLSHINVCRYTNMLRLDENTYLLVSEGYSLTLNKVLNCSKEEFGKLNFARTINQVISGIQYLHTSGFSHGKLTLECLSVSDEGVVKISGYASNYFNSVLNYLVDKFLNNNQEKEIKKENYRNQEISENNNDEEISINKGNKTNLKNKESLNNYIMSPFDWSDDGSFVEFAKESGYLFNLLPYMPPELIFFNKDLEQNHLFWFNVDIWSLGICILIIVSYVISVTGISNEFGSVTYPNDICKIGENGVSLPYLNINDCKNCRYFEKIKKLFNSDSPNEYFVESFVFVSYLLLLINKFESTGSLSTLGLDVPKILNEQFSTLTFLTTNGEEYDNGLGVISKIFQSINLNCDDNYKNLDGEFEEKVENKYKTHDIDNDYKDHQHGKENKNKEKEINKENNRNQEINGKENIVKFLKQQKLEKEELNKYEEALLLSVEFLTGGDILRKLIEYEQKKDEYKDNEENNKRKTKVKDNDNKVEENDVNHINDIHYLLSLAHDCLIITNSSRPSIVDINSKRSFLKLPLEYLKTNEETHCWFICRDKGEEENNNEHSFSESYSLESIKELDLNLSESKFFLNYVDMENVLYYWSLLGNEPENIVPFEYKNKIEIESDCYKNKKNKMENKNKNQALEYFKRYKVGKVFLGELITHVKLANLFPMIIEHQLRPSCVYARQHCFIYQLLRIRRFKRLLSNPIENKRQIFVEAMIDIPPLLRNQIWCNLLEIVYTPGKRSCPINTEYEFMTLPADVEQNLSFYNNDLLYSSNNVKVLMSNVENLKNKIIQQQLPSSIYSFAIPLLMLYHDSKVYSLVLEKIFCKYLKEFYSPTGSFVNNYLSEFSTILNFFDPEVSYHLRNIGAYADSYALPWFMSLFGENTSVDQLYLIWDSILVQPKQYIKFLAVMIIHNIRERLLGINDASMAISFISCVMDSLNVPMLMYLTTHMYNTWSEVLNTKVSGQKPVQNLANELSDRSETEVDKQKEMNENKYDTESINLDKNTFVFISEEYPFERCFKLSIETFSNVFSNCIIIDLRSLESYNLGHIPNSIHINKVLSGLSEKDKKTTPISLSIFNDQNGFNTNIDFNSNSSYSQTISSLNGLRNNSKKPWLHINTPEMNKVILAAGDGYDNENEMFYVQRLAFEFNLQHVCYYRINTEEWPKVFTLSKM